MDTIHCSNPIKQYLSYKDEIQTAINGVLESGRYVLGSNVQQFEEDFAKFIGATKAIGVGSGTDALYLSLKSLGIGHGDEVITVSHTALATVSAILMTQATPVLVDIDPVLYTMDPNTLESAITNRTKAIIPVHLYGQSVDMDSVLQIAKKFDLKVIEDCAQAHGATYKGKPVGALGDLGCFSFYPTKNLGGIGDGGAIVTSNSQLADRIRALREYGWGADRIAHEASGVSRLDELQAVILNIKLKHLADDNQRRVSIAKFYQEELMGMPVTLPTLGNGNTHVYHLFVVATDNRNALAQYLASRNIDTGIHYPISVHQQPGYENKVLVSKALANTENVVSRILSLPMYPELTIDEIQHVVHSIKGFYENANS